MFTTIKKAGLSIDEFSRIVDVNRTSIFNWKAGRSKPHVQVAERVEKMTRFLERLVEQKKLPPKEGLSREERKAKLQQLKEQFRQSE